MRFGTRIEWDIHPFIVLFFFFTSLISSLFWRGRYGVNSCYQNVCLVSCRDEQKIQKTN
jgi:hypothetical protein